jgi:hypothetical protein
LGLAEGIGDDVNQQKKKMKKQPRLKVLPRQLSALCDLVIADLPKVAKRKGVVVFMGDWLISPKHLLDHAREWGGVLQEAKVQRLAEKGVKCLVCVAGAVAMVELGAKPSPYLPDDFPESRDQLGAIDHLRMGCVYSAADRVGLSHEDRDLAATLNRTMPPYTGKGTKFLKAMRQLSADLKAVGL